MFHHAVVVVHVDVGEGVRATFGAQQERIARRVVARAVCTGRHAHLSAISVLTLPGRDAFRDDCRAGVGG